MTTPGTRGWIVLALIALASLATCARPAFAEHDHSKLGAAGRFYETWMQPDHPWVSCCHDQDCDAAASKFDPVTQRWFARYKDDDEWVEIPPEKVDQERETPDGRSHMCGRRSGFGNFNVFCFVRGGGV